MELKQEKYLDSSEILWEKLSGKRIILAGIAGRQKEIFWQSLTYKSSQMGEAFEVSDDLAGAGENDYVFLFGGMEHSSELSGLLEELKILAQKKVASAVLVSDNRVYGKVFGAGHKLSEYELGYACHTSADDQVITAIRMAEHLAYRMAEEGAPVRIVRVDAEASRDDVKSGLREQADAEASRDDVKSGLREQADAGVDSDDVKSDLREQTGDKPGIAAAKSGTGTPAGGGALTTVLEAAVKVLLFGAPGEVYNLPMQIKEQETEPSPLSPLHIKTDAAKLETIKMR